ncbi:hypothetical protein SNE40_000087 [Patella caerulea]|uniref:Uncharacterized protein n=1 Tax=Patella caerulea TaxID=87958 RepID=A0AAN8Q9M1_PATCE
MANFKLNLLLVCFTSSLIGAVDGFSCVEDGEARVTECSAELHAIATASGDVTEQQCRKMKMAIKCIQDIEDKCNDAMMETPVLNSISVHIPAIVEAINADCGEYDTCELAEDLVDECIDMGIESLGDTQASPKEMCKSVDEQLSCVENVIYLCPTVSSEQKVETAIRRQRFMDICGRYFSNNGRK